MLPQTQNFDALHLIEFRAETTAERLRALHAGMSMDVKTSRRDMTVHLHLDAVTVQDMARPDDSPFRNMIYSKPDESSHGGLIHVTYWSSSGGIRRLPPVWIVEDNHDKFDMVVDARFSTLQVRLVDCPDTWRDSVAGVEILRVAEFPNFCTTYAPTTNSQRRGEF